MDNLFDIHKPLICATPQAWLEAALEHQDILLIDHANCEKKAAATAMSLMFQYGERYPQLQEILSRLAREELRHFEQVTRLMRQRGVRFRALSAARYAGGLRKHVRKCEPERLLDLLMLGALIEARSCERFQALVPILDTEMSKFYARLAAVESRHFNVYMKLARQIGGDSVAARHMQFAAIEAKLITDRDRDFRFHSGPLH